MKDSMKGKSTMDRLQWEKVSKDLNALCDLHEGGVSDPKKCREFNSQASRFLGVLEEMNADEMADRMMDLLAGCSPKDFSPCDNRQCTKGSLERLQERVRVKLEK
jgi:uncharacterized protein with von Willebrand factor type A (vWA) domain